MEIQHLMWKLEELADAFRNAVYLSADLEKVLACVTDDVEVTNLPTGTGTHGAAELQRHLTEAVHPHLPADLAFRRVSRTVDQRRLAEETMVTFTHDRPLPWLLPGAPPTGRQAEVLAVTVMSVRHRSRLGRTTVLVARHRTLWDHTNLLAQLGLESHQVVRTVA